MQKLDLIGIIVLFIGIFSVSFLVLFFYDTPTAGLYGELSLMVLLIGIGIVVLSAIRKWRSSKSELENKKNNQYSKSIKDLADADGETTTSDTKLGKQCRVCSTHIPHDAKNCPGCGDIYS